MSLTGSVLSSKLSESVSQTAAVGSVGNRFRLMLFILLCIEIGIFLLLVPWSPLWAQNWIVSYFPSLRSLYMNLYLRGAVSGLGLINLWLGFWQAWNFRRLTAKPAGDD